MTPELELDRATYTFWEIAVDHGLISDDATWSDLDRVVEVYTGRPPDALTADEWWTLAASIQEAERIGIVLPDDVDPQLSALVDRCEAEVESARSAEVTAAWRRLRHAALEVVRHGR